MGGARDPAREHHCRRHPAAGRADLGRRADRDGAAVTERLRGRAGKAQRLRRLLRSGFMCELCARQATVVDHVVPLSLGGADTDANTRNLCDGCHREVTAEQFGRAYRPVGHRTDGTPADPAHPWNRQGGGSKSSGLVVGHRPSPDFDR